MLKKRGLGFLFNWIFSPLRKKMVIWLYKNNATADLANALCSVKQLQLEITSRCNFRCIMCDQAYRCIKGKDLNLSDFETILDKLPGITTLCPQGLGEPLLNPDFMAMLELAKKRAIYTYVNTNFGLFTENIAKELARLADSVTISFSAGTKETYELTERVISRIINRLIKELEEILASSSKILNVIKKEIQEVKEKYGEDRRTHIVAHGVKEFSMEDLIPNEPTIIMATRDGYIKRMPTDTFKTQGRGGKGVVGLITKEEDVVDQLIATHTHDNMLFFTSRGRVFQMQAYDIPQATRTAKGQALINFLQLAPNEKVSAILSMDDVIKYKYLVMVTSKGVIKKTALEDFKNVRNSGLIALKIKPDDMLEWVRPSTGKDDVVIITSAGQAIRFREAGVRSMGRTASGVRGIRLRANDSVVGMNVVSSELVAKKVYELLVVSENGLGKRSGLTEYKVQGRGGSGIKTMSVTSKTGRVIGAAAINNTDELDLMLISVKGQVVRTPLESVPTLGRATQGVRVMRFKQDGDKVASITLL